MKGDGEGSGGGGVKGGCWSYVLNIREARVTKIEQVQTRGEGWSKLWAFCDNVIIECACFFVRSESIFLLFL